jgi:hypothetical protein
VHGTERHGATVIAVLHKPRTLVLLVQGIRRHHPVIIGLVPLGSHPVGTSKIHWNLRVEGRLLGEAPTRSPCTRSRSTCSPPPPRLASSR